MLEALERIDTRTCKDLYYEHEQGDFRLMLQLPLDDLVFVFLTFSVTVLWTQFFNPPAFQSKAIGSCITTEYLLLSEYGASYSVGKQGKTFNKIQLLEHKIWTFTVTHLMINVHWKFWIEPYYILKKFHEINEFVITL